MTRGNCPIAQRPRRPLVGVPQLANPLFRNPEAESSVTTNGRARWANRSPTVNVTAAHRLADEEKSALAPIRLPKSAPRAVRLALLHHSHLLLRNPGRIPRYASSINVIRLSRKSAHPVFRRNLLRNRPQSWSYPHAESPSCPTSPRSRTDNRSPHRSFLLTVRTKSLIGTTRPLQNPSRNRSAARARPKVRERNATPPRLPNPPHTARPKAVLLVRGTRRTYRTLPSPRFHTSSLRGI